MTDEYVLAALRKLPDDLWLETLSDMHIYERGLQAQISFKAGIKEVAEYIDNLWDSDDKTGIHFIKLSEGEWQAKLKEWRIK